MRFGSPVVALTEAVLVDCVGLVLAVTLIVTNTRPPTLMLPMLHETCSVDGYGVVCEIVFVVQVP